MTEKQLWRVHAYSHAPISSACDEVDEGGMYKQYDHYFSEYDDARRIHEVGEKTMGIAYGMHWHLERVPVDSQWAEVDLDDLASELRGAA